MFQNWYLMHIAWISMKITVSELKQPWSVLLQSKNSEIFTAGTAIIRSENLWSLLKITEHCLTLMKIYEHYWKCLRTSLNIYENLWSSLKSSKHNWTTRKISARLWKSLNIAENYYLNSETVWNPLLALFIAEWPSTYVLSTFYELHLRKTLKEKENKLTIRTIKHTSGNTRIEIHSEIFDLSSLQHQ